MYSFLPFNFSYLDNQSVLLVNDAGISHFLSSQVFEHFVKKELPPDSEDFLDLESKLFATVGKLEPAIRKLAVRYRSKQEFLRDFTTLHIMVLTLRCNQKCAYCQVSSAGEDECFHDMSVSTAKKTIDFIFSGPASHVKIEFQGGEPTLNWEAMRAAVARAEHVSEIKGKKADFVVCTNLLNLDDSQIDFYGEHNIQISTSLDGPAYIHNKHRVTRQGNPTRDKIIASIRKIRKKLGNFAVSALMTATADSLKDFLSIVDEYLSLGMDGIFFRSLNPYGLAAIDAASLGYAPEEFAEHYLAALEYILEINRETFFPEYFATLLFTRILTAKPTGFVDLQSPAGAGIAGAIYDYDGSVYPSDEARMLARMGDDYFRLGNVHTNSFREVFCGEKMLEITSNSCIETTIPCAWCVFRIYCGTDPIRNYLETGCVRRNMAGSSFCIMHKLIFEGLFKILRDADDERMGIIWNWIMNRRNHENP